MKLVLQVSIKSETNISNIEIITEHKFISLWERNIKHEKYVYCISSILKTGLQCLVNRVSDILCNNFPTPI